MSRTDHVPVDNALRVLEAGKAREAFATLKLLSEAGNDAAYPMLGYMYDVGEGTRKNAKHAIRWYLAGYKSGSSMCAANMATIYRDVGDSRNEYKWYTRAARMGDGDAQVEVAIRLLSGKGVRRSVTEAVRLLKKVRSMPNTSDAARELAKQLLWGCAVVAVPANKSLERSRER